MILHLYPDDVVAKETADLFSNIETHYLTTVNGVIYNVYNVANGTREQVIDQAVFQVKGEVEALTNEFIANSKNDAICTSVMNEVNNTFNTTLENVRGQVSSWSDNVLVDARDQAIKMVNESTSKVFDQIEKTSKEKIAQLSEKVKESIKGKIPVGEVVNTGEKSTVKMDYEDYLRVLLLMMNQQKKVERIQSLIQANMIHGGHSEFKMENSAVAIWADMECSIRYLFMTNAIFPKEMKREGRMTFSVHSAMSY